MSKEIYISSTPHETRLAIVENDALAEMYYERENEYTLAGSIYNGRVTRVLPGMQSSFVDIGLERDAFLYITDFMEEAGDSADFETSDARGGGGRRDRGERPRRDAEPTGESAGAGEEVVARSESSRSEGGRSEGGRGEGRGDRDRGGRNRNRGGRDGRSGGEARAGNEGRTAEARPSVSDEPRTVAGDAVHVEPQDGDAGDVGEGAPGADGGRRWRGRRGRRRGRGTGDETPQTAESQGEGGEVPEMSAAAVEVPRDEPVARPERSDRGDRGGRDRGGRDRGGRGDRGGRDGGRERFAPREARGGSDVEETSSAPAVEPFILPGESLSKYRRGADGAPEASAVPAATPANVTFVTAKPSTEFVVDPNWDGGSVLPGETLSRHRGGNDRGGTDRGGNDRGGTDRGGNARGERDRGGRGREERSGRERFGRQEFQSQKLDPSEAVQPAVTSAHEPGDFALERPLTIEPPDEVFETSADAPVVEEPLVEAFSEPVEYEPEEDASVSFKVDPVAPSEFRQSAPVDFAAAEAMEPEALVNPAEFAQPQAPVFVAEEQDAYVETPVAPEIDAHAFTAVQPTGEMLSAPVELAEEVHVADQVAAPIAHEAAVQSVTLAEAQTGAVVPSAAQGYAPGDGQLEEEELDEDEGDLPMLHAGGDDDMEEETLENAADLGSMIREMSIDQITRPADPIDEDDDFDIDEEDLDHDEFDNGEEEEEGLSGSEVSEGEEDEFSESGDFEETAQGEEGAQADGAARTERPAGREGDRRPRRDGRGDRDRGRGRGDRDRGRRDGRGMANSRSGGGGSGGGRSRQSMQSTNLPDISDLLKPGQELLVQIAKEPIAKKGARITSHIALPGRFLVFMPTVNHVGVSRKIESDGERRRLKEILLSEKGDASGGFIVRTAAASAGEDELRSDLRFLLNLWADIKQRSDSSKSPALIYHDLNLIERILRDQVTDNFSAIWVDSESEYERVLRFLQSFQPSLIRRVKLYTKETPLFEQFGITEEINKALRSKVWLKSGGSIVINQTEALVAIDINTGKFVGKTARLEDTIVKTNLDAIPEIVRQIRLRDLGGIIIIDFIDMDERKNRNKVMAALEDELKSDRAPSKVLQFNDFGLVAITRKRVKQSLERTLSTTCGVCQGTGMVKSPVTVCNDIYIEMKKMQKHLDRGDVMLRVNPEVVKQLKAPGTKWLQEMEEMCGRTILVKSDPSLHPEQFDIH